MGFFDNINSCAQNALDNKFYDFLSKYEYSMAYETEAAYKDGSNDDIERQAALIAYIRLCDKEPVEFDIDYSVEWELLDNTKTYVPLKDIPFSKRRIEKVYDDRIDAWYNKYKDNDKSVRELNEILNEICLDLSNSLQYRNVSSDTFDVNVYEMAALKHILINEHQYDKSLFSDIVLEYAFDSDYCPVTQKYKLG